MSIFGGSKKTTPGIKEPKDPTKSPFAAPEGFWIRCAECHAILQHTVVETNNHVCTECGYHFRIGARRRLELVCDPGSFVEMDQDLGPKDVLGFFDSKAYAERIASASKKTRLKDAFIGGQALLKNRKVQVGAFEFSYMGGSMGMVVGEKVARLFDRALQTKSPAIIFHASGGARMQEGILSLMQMAKTTAALGKLRQAGLPYISVLTDPTTGGVAASFAMLGDLNIAEPNSLVGFAGPRVIEQTINQKLPEGFQRAEFLLDHGMIDQIVQRREMRSYLDRVLNYLT
ncbi:MAG: acetyl-CoA carboxylase carboxyltransferase subunit beta [Bdellovibrionales bacterium]|nr:acetyl-CoA carboxylase carboxyltransferase subunit beta [Bdellovibrionales bacterium]